MVERLKRKTSIIKRIDCINKELQSLKKRQNIKKYPRKGYHKNFLFGVLLMLAFILIIALLKQNNGITGFMVIDNSTETPIIDNEVIDELELENETSVIIVLTTSEFSTAMANMTERSEFSISSEYDYHGISRFEGFNVITAKITKTGLEKLRQSPLIAAVFFDKVLSISLQDSIHIINAANLSENNITGANTNICLLDTGADLGHPELNNSFIGGYDFINNDNIPQDDHNHGTHTAGIIHRINPDTKIIPVKVCDGAGRCRASTVLNGISYCLQNKNTYNISVLSGSFGDGGQYNRENCPTYLGDTFNVIERMNITSLFASGNNGYRNGINYPACEDEVISVGATDKQDNIAGFTNTGTALDVLAPGVNINSTIINGYGILTGTSMSTPHASAAVSILKAGRDMNTTAIRDILRATGNLIEGYPRINVLSALQNISTPEAITANETNSSCNELATNLTLTDETNITCLKITAPDVIIDCNGYTLIGDMNEGIIINETGNRTTIRNCKFSGFKTALKITDTEGVIVENPASNTSYNLSNARITLKNDSFIEFKEAITASGNDLTEAIQLKNNTIKIDSATYPQFNKTAELGFDTNFTNPLAGYDERDIGNYSECPAARCTEINYTPPLFKFQVAGFTTYTVLENLIENVTPPQNTTNETAANQTQNQTESNQTNPANQTQENQTNAAPAQSSQSSFSSSPNYPVYSKPQATAAIAAETEDAQQLQGFLESIERKEATKAEQAKTEEIQPTTPTEQAEEPTKQSTPLGYALLKGTSIFKDNIDILIIVTLIFCLTGAGIYYKVYKATRTGIINKKQEPLPKRICLRLWRLRRKKLLKS